MTYRSHLRAYPTENGIRRTTIVLRCTAFIRVVVAIAWNAPLIMPSRWRKTIAGVLHG
jgi:hypothetical protein